MSPPSFTLRRGIRSCAETTLAREPRLIRVFELFKVGIGPSSSHTVGPMKAAAAFVDGLARSGAIERVDSVVVTLFGSLAFTGKGHATDKAVILGLSGERPDTVDPDRAEALVADADARKSIVLSGRRAIRFDPQSDIRFDYVTAPKRHPNTLAFCARDAAGRLLSEETWLSVGGGFIVREDEEPAADAAGAAFPHPFRDAAELLARARRAVSKSANSCAPTRWRRARLARSTRISMR